MRFGISLPNFGDFADVRELCNLAQEAEEAGWHGFFLWDHINWSEGPMIDPWVALGAIAAATSRIKIGTMITPLARRRPWMVARQTVTLDHLSGGRLILGVGLGFPPDKEYSDLGEDPDDRARARKLDEALDIVTGLWSGEEFAYAGKEFKIAGARFLPKPVQQPRIPIWVAGTWPIRAPFRRAARYDGAFPMAAAANGEFDFTTPDDIRATREFVSSQRADDTPYEVAAGRKPPWVEERGVDEFAAAGLTWWMETEFTRDELRGRLRTPLPL